MGYAELINKLQALPREKQAEVFEFVEFLSERCGASADKPLKRAETVAQTWNAFNERFGSFADQHSTLTVRQLPPPRRHSTGAPQPAR